MDKTYRFYLSISNKILAGLLALLGFSNTSCSPVDEYGSPYATYEIKGKVVNEKGTAIPDMQVIIPAPDADNEEDQFMYRDTLLTNSTGEFNKRLEVSSFGEDITFKIATQDIDGEANGGLFEDTVTEVAFKKDDLKGGDGNWYAGNAKKDVTITMKRDPLVCD
ncbi:radical SAM-associated putative lipoprotein [Parabacteroides gordonii]|jgi:putative lipoprotein (rSAM/lipoprotein system)|uniref:radical SAM-associated putative lipoprotein n=1 Tax=Parabacteroides gordonii TaxID=574930 RepID=UPI00241D41E9|nr:radical SAM-associated putative lipoprotein [Parabacteroides gordonii]